MHFKLFPIINKSDRRSNVLLGILKSVHSMVDHTFNLLIGSSFSKKKCFTGIEEKKKTFRNYYHFLVIQKATMETSRKKRHIWQSLS